MNIKIKCNDCVHKEVCAIKNSVSEIEEIINVGDMVKDEVEIELGCKHYSANSQPYISPTISPTISPNEPYYKWCCIYNHMCDKTKNSCLECHHMDCEIKVPYSTSSVADIPGAINRTEGIDSDRSRR